LSVPLPQACYILNLFSAAILWQVSGEEYLIEVKNKEVAKVPQDWSRINATKAVTRMRSPFIVDQVGPPPPDCDRLPLQPSSLARLPFYHRCSTPAATSRPHADMLFALSHA